MARTDILGDYDTVVKYMEDLEALGKGYRHPTIYRVFPEQDKVDPDSSYLKYLAWRLNPDSQESPPKHGKYHKPKGELKQFMKAAYIYTWYYENYHDLPLLSDNKDPTSPGKSRYRVLRRGEIMEEEGRVKERDQLATIVRELTTGLGDRETQRFERLCTHLKKISGESKETQSYLAMLFFPLILRVEIKYDKDFDHNSRSQSDEEMLEAMYSFEVFHEKVQQATI